MGRKPINERISDWTMCPHCAVENNLLGGGKNYADDYFNTGDYPGDVHGQLWAICRVHSVRWYVTRTLLGFGPHRPDLMALPEVEAVDGQR
jgi:hypothetical protein